MDPTNLAVCFGYRGDRVLDELSFAILRLRCRSSRTLNWAPFRQFTPKRFRPTSMVS